MEIFTIMLLATVAVVTCTTTFFVTKNIYNDEHENLKAHVNNQLIINEERDRSHEFSQTVFIIILAILTSIITVFMGLKCAINAALNRTRRPTLAVRETQPQQQVAFEP